MQLSEKYVTILISSSIAVLGWGIASYINSRAFNRTEISKLKDRVSQLFEAFFLELDKKLGNKGVKESELDDLIGEKLAIIELQLNHLKRKNGLILVSDDILVKLRSKPYDFIHSHEKPSKDINDLKFDTLEEIEEKYTKWYFEQKVTFTATVKYIWIRVKQFFCF